MHLPPRGSLSDATFIEILKDAASSPLTGMIRLENGSTIKVVYLQKGTISFASSNEKSDRLTEVLKRAGKLTPEQVQDAQTRLKPNVSLGKTLVELGYISAKDLLWGARAQVDGILHQLLYWNEGKYQILEGTLPREIIHLNLPIPSVIFEGIMKTQDRDWILQHIGSPEAVYALSSDFEDQNQALKLPVSKVVSKINGKRSLHDIAQGSGIDTFDLCKTVVALDYLDLARPIQDEPLQMELNSPTETRIPSSTTEGEEQQSGNVVQPPAVQNLQMQPEVEQTVEPEKSAEPSERTDEIDGSQQSSTEEPGEPLNIQKPEEVVPVQEQEPTLSTAAETAAAPDEPPIEYAEEVAEPPQKRFSRDGILTVLLLIAAVALLVFYFWQHRRNPSQKKLVQEEVLQPVEEPSDPPYPDAPTTIDATEPERVPPSDLAPDDPRSLLRDGKIADAASSWSDTLSENGKSYSIQLVIACQEKTVIDTHSMLNYSEEMIVLPISYKGQNCYRVLFGQYSSRNAAQAAIQDLPEVFIRQSSPASVVSMAKVLP